jgi:hypothetical protein
MGFPANRVSGLLVAGLLAAGASGCAKAVSTSGFKGEQHEVAQTIANLQSDVTSGDEQKICANDLAQAIVSRLNAAPGGCKQAIKDQLAELDSYEVTVESVRLGSANTANATVKSVVSGKKATSALELRKEGGKWKVSGVS